MKKRQLLIWGGKWERKYNQSIPECTVLYNICIGILM